MTRLIIPALVALIVIGAAGGGHTRDKKGFHTSYGHEACSEYLDAYSKANLTGKNAFKGEHDAWKIFGWINGYITAFNLLAPNGKSDILGSMTMNNARKWMASWCRDNPSKDISDALNHLILKIQ